MKVWYRQLRNEYKIAVWSTIIILALVVVTIPCFFFSLMEIPQGIALGGLIGIVTYLLLGITNNEEKQKKSLVFAVIIMILRFLLLTGIMVLVAWLYYAKGVKAFNPFAVVGGYSVTLIVNAILVVKEKESVRS